MKYLYFTVTGFQKRRREKEMQFDVELRNVYELQLYYSLRNCKILMRKVLWLGETAAIKDKADAM